MASTSQLESWLAAPQMRAALDAIAYGEAVSYNETHGGGSFSNYADHPYISYASDHSNCRAAGRYQFCSFTWASLKSQYGFSDFSPHSQDLGAVALISQAGAVSNILAGNWQGTIPKLNHIWPSLPGGSQQNRTLTQSLNYFQGALSQYGGAAGAANVIAATPPTQSNPIFSTPHSDVSYDTSVTYVNSGGDTTSYSNPTYTQQLSIDDQGNAIIAQLDVNGNPVAASTAPSNDYSGIIVATAVAALAAWWLS